MRDSMRRRLSGALVEWTTPPDLVLANLHGDGISSRKVGLDRRQRGRRLHITWVFFFLRNQKKVAVATVVEAPKDYEKELDTPFLRQWRRKVEKREEYPRGRRRERE